MSEWLAWQIVDSAFPTGTFAHSWGLEAAWQQGEVNDAASLRAFVDATIRQTARGAIPLVNAAYRTPTPDRFATLDRLADAFLINPVANAASRVQGRTLLATIARIWPCPAIADLQAYCLPAGAAADPRAAASGAACADDRADAGNAASADAPSRVDAAACAHVAPVTGAAFRAIGVPLETVQRAVLYAAARGVVAAAVRLGIAGSYEAQRLLFECGPALETIAVRCRDWSEDDLAQTEPIVDLLQAAHARLYSRLFQS